MLSVQITQRQKRVISGALFAAVGIVAIVWSQQYSVGSVSAMGPGYFPMVLGVLLAVLGLAAVVEGVNKRSEKAGEAFSIEPFLLVLLAVVAFGLLVGRVGLIPTIFVIVFICCLRRAIQRPLEVFLSFAVLSLFAGVVFVHFLAMPIKLFTWSW